MSDSTQLRSFVLIRQGRTKGPIRLWLLAALGGLAALCLVALGFPESVSKAHAAGPLPSYKLNVRLDFSSARLDVEQTVVFPNRTGVPLNEIAFNVTPANYNAFTLHRAAVNGQEVTSSLSGVVLEVPLSPPLPPGESALLFLDYSLQVPQKSGRFGFSEGILALGNWFPILEVYRGPWLASVGQPQGWAKAEYTEVGDAFFSDVADYEVTLKAEKTLTIAHTGALVQQAEDSWTFRAERVRDFALVISDRYQTVSRTVNGVTVTAFYLPEHAEVAANYLDGAQMAGWLSSYLGPYPDATLHIAEVGNVGSSMVGQEYPGLVFVGSALVAQRGSLASYLSNIVVHEVAHQWFYSLVGNDQLYEPWLDEALVSWLSYHFLRVNHSEFFPSAWAALQARTRSERSLIDSRPVSGSVYDYPDEGTYFAVVYRRGIEFVERLYQAMGEEAFAAALRRYTELFRYRTATAAAFFDIMQSHTTVDLNPLIAEFFSYPRFKQAEPLRAEVTFPTGQTWSGSVVISIASPDQLSRVSVLADDQFVSLGQAGPQVSIDTTKLPNGEYLFILDVVAANGAERQYFQKAKVENRATPIASPNAKASLPTAVPSPVDEDPQAATHQPTSSPNPDLSVNPLALSAVFALALIAVGILISLFRE